MKSFYLKQDRIRERDRSGGARDCAHVAIFSFILSDL